MLERAGRADQAWSCGDAREPRTTVAIATREEQRVRASASTFDRTPPLDDVGGPHHAVRPLMFAVHEKAGMGAGPLSLPAFCRLRNPASRLMRTIVTS